MKESIFIQNNLDSWKENENLITKKNYLPPKLNQIFIKSTDDLSYANTYYKNRSVRVYLNGVAKILYNRINKSERFTFTDIKKFFTNSVPLAIYEARKEFIFALSLFLISVLIGIVSSKNDNEFSQLILGKAYVDMTEENIANNDPMAVYKSAAPFDMFLAVTVNNSYVALKTFVSGLFMAIGTFIILIYNGIMVGTFQYYFVEQDLFRESFLTIWQHGILEMSSIVMAGAAGIVMGKGLIFPGNYSRFQSLRISARRGIKLFLGIIPILIVAAFIEGFYTRFTEIGDGFRLITLLASLAFITGYFVLLPMRRSKENPGYTSSVRNPGSPSSGPIKLDKIYSVPEIFMLTFNILKTYLKQISTYTILISLLMPLAIFILNRLNIDLYSVELYTFNPVYLLQDNPAGILILYLLVSILSIFLTKIRIDASGDQKQNIPHSFGSIIQILLLQLFVHAPLFLSNGFGIFIYALLMIYSSFLLNISIIERVGIYKALRSSLNYLKTGYGSFIIIAFRFALLGVLFYLVFNILILQVNNEFIQMNLYSSEEQSYKLMLYINSLYFSFMLLLQYTVFYLGNQVLYFSLYEATSARGLLSRINGIGSKKRIRGLHRE